MSNSEDTICAISTAPGVGGIAVVRVSGKMAFDYVEQIFSKPIAQAATHTAHFGKIVYEGKIVDEVLATIFQGKRSFTGENTVEISCHGGLFVQQQILRLLVDRGCRMADPGEFSMRSFLNGKMDLSQAEAVADLIASENAASHAQAMHQMRGGFSKEISTLRERLIHFASLIELELDFSEEDVEFANRTDLKDLVDEILTLVVKLVDSFSLGNVIKQGVPVAIMGAPNRGKSTLLNALLKDDRAIVSSIAGTTRDTIEDTVVIEGVQFRFIDTAGIRTTENEIENIGIARAFEKANSAAVILYMVDAGAIPREELVNVMHAFQDKIADPNKSLIVIGNKIDAYHGDLGELYAKFEFLEDVVFLSALTGENMEGLTDLLIQKMNLGEIENHDTIVTNERHYKELLEVKKSLTEVRQGLDDDITGDFLAIDIRKSLHHLGAITGEISTDDLLANIFSRFCIGK